MTDKQSLGGATREALAAALREHIAGHRAEWPTTGHAYRGGMQRALHIVETTHIPAAPAAPAAPELPSTVYVVRARLDIDHPDEGVYLSRDAAMAAARRIAVGFAGNPGAVWERVSPSETGWVGFGCGDGLVVSAGPEPLRDAPRNGLPEWLPTDTGPSLAWADDLDDDDQADFLADLRKATETGVAAVADVLSTWWVIAAGERAQQEAPGPDAPQHGLPVVDEAAVTAALGEPLPRNLPADTAPGLSFRDALASFYAYVDDEDGGA